ncbi:MAG: protein-glutamate O-methyltransferase CheR [Bacteroidales bacterium]|nr:protein-glutamate O-methyltransferase CheR [Bacteroidales bacterium]MDD3663826.1 protein-glutamate O-methyltransferase CheR [Bacteroidales bacterium]
MTHEEINEIQNIEIKLFLEALFQRYGYDFRNYSQAHIKRRLLHRMNLGNFSGISQMQHKILYDSGFVQQILLDLSINVTEMFRDPSFYASVRKEVVPILKTYPFIKTWHAGCSTGEEVYSMAILFKEENILNRTQIYATDFNHKVLKTAKEGIYPIDLIKDYTTNYQKAGGKESFSDYYDANYNSVIIDGSLKKNIVFADHNLVTDSVFAEVNLIVCRNVLIYFNRELQDKVIKLFLDSLTPGGILCLGSKENLQYSAHFEYFSVIDTHEKIYRKEYRRPSTSNDNP